MPPVVMVERPDEIMLRADLPGLEEKDRNGVLEVHRPRTKEAKAKKIEIKVA